VEVNPLGRPVDPNAKFRVKPHVTKGYTYASTQPPEFDPVTGKKVYRHIHWGTVDEDLKFKPGEKFYSASPKQRAQLIFPDNWDMSEAIKLTGLRKPCRLKCDLNCQNLLYGDIWLLEQVAIKTNIRQDLEAVFDGNLEIVDDILTLAIFPYLTEYTYNRLATWQKIVRAPSSRELTPSVITRLTQSITERHRMELLKLRGARLGKDEVCAVDSTSRSAYGDNLADIKWGKNKEGIPLPQTNEVVVYSLSSHIPIYYRTFPGNMPDSRSIDVILKDLDDAGFKNLVLLTDRAYETVRNLETLISRGQRLIMCAKTSQKDIAKAIDDLGEFGCRPETMTIDPETMHYYQQYGIKYEVTGKRATVKKADRLKLNLYFDPVRRAREQLELDACLYLQNESLNEILKHKLPMLDDASIKRDYCYYKVVYDPTTRILKDFKLNDKKVDNARKHTGFYSILTHGLDFDAVKTFNTYRLRDEQEKYFQQMKSQMVSDRQRNWSEAGKTGRLFIMFVSLILASHVRHVWKSTKLHDIFSSSLAIIDEMRSIRYIEHANSTPMLTPFVGTQLEICQEFGFEIPDGCAPAYTSRKKLKRKRGRPPKKMV
jgi:transposase